MNTDRKLAVYATMSRRWVEYHFDRLRAAGDPLLNEALDIVFLDSTLVAADVTRVSLERSETAWRTIVRATSDPVAVLLAGAVRDLGRVAASPGAADPCRM